MDGQSLRFRDPEHVRSVIDALKTRDLSADDDVSPRLRALSAGCLDAELEGMVCVALLLLNVDDLGYERVALM